MWTGAAGGYVCGEGFLNGQLTVTRALGDFHPELLALQRTRERLKYRVSDKEPVELTGPLTSGRSECLCPWWLIAFTSSCGVSRCHTAALIEVVID